MTLKINNYHFYKLIDKLKLKLENFLNSKKNSKKY